MPDDGGKRGATERRPSLRVAQQFAAVHEVGDAIALNGEGVQAAQPVPELRLRGGDVPWTAITLGAFGSRATAALIASRAAAPAGEAAVTISVVGRSAPASAVDTKSAVTRNTDAPTQVVARTVASFEVEATKLRAGAATSMHGR